MRDTYSKAEAERIVREAKAEDKVIQLDRIGAQPYLKYTPYKNHNGVKIHQWTCVTVMLHARPERTLLGYPTIVKPWDNGSWEVNHISDEWVVARLMETHEELDVIREPEDTPFDGELVGGWCEN